MINLDELESKSVFIIREAKQKFKNPAVLWSMGKDSTTMLWLCRKAFFGSIPFKAVHLDTGCKFKEIYEFRDRISREWGIDLVVARNREADAEGITPDDGRFECCNARKTEALKQVIEEYKFDAILLGIRRDEHSIRDKERYFSPRDRKFRWRISEEKKGAGGDAPYDSLQDTELSGWNLFATDFKDADHVRVHPLLHWTELEIWEYVRRENIPTVPLYFAKNGKRYRSIGCECCCNPVKSDSDTIDKIIDELDTTDTEERAGRAQDKESEYMMQKLRSLGYM
ncbi:MAG: sulfate adenylyltransferase subunit CysD [Candidatus Altiarchaeota archaeon]